MYSLPPWAYQIVPLNAEKDSSLIAITKAVQVKHKQDIVKVNSMSCVLDIAMEQDIEEAKNEKIVKESPVKHFYIDFKGLLLNRSLRAVRDFDNTVSAE